MNSIVSYDYSQIIEYLLDWYDVNARILPWRTNPKPYYVWISEIMLQQTRVEAVKSYFERFIRELPTIQSLAEVEDDTLFKLWEGLGYYNRARNLKKAAVQVMEQYHGELPRSYDKLLTLSGIGSYTAGAIASIAYGIPVPAVDGNVMRVTMRISNNDADITKQSVKKQVEQDLLAIMPERAGDFNQSLMELGATVCIPNGKPLCEVCPVMHLCQAIHHGTTMQLPVKPAKKPRKIEELTVFIIEADGEYAIQKRESKGLLADLWELPNKEGHIPEKQLPDIVNSFGSEECQVHAVNTQALGEAKHIFSHVEWRMIGYYISLNRKPANSPYLWATKQKIQDDYAIPTAFEAYKKILKESR